MLQFCLPIIINSKFALLFEKPIHLTVDQMIRMNRVLPEDLGGNKEIYNWLLTTYESYRNTGSDILRVANFAFWLFFLKPEGPLARSRGVNFTLLSASEALALARCPQCFEAKWFNTDEVQHTPSRGSLFFFFSPLLWKWMKVSGWNFYGQKAFHFKVIWMN